MPDMTGRPGCWTMEMFGGSAASYLARTPRIPLFVLIFIGLETKNVLGYQGRAGSTSIVQWTLRPVIFGVEYYRGGGYLRRRRGREEHRCREDVCGGRGGGSVPKFPPSAGKSHPWTNASVGGNF